VEGRYKKLYEENIDPFKEFSRKVSSKTAF
jgi:hypothetical protein